MGTSADLHGVTDGKAAAASGVTHAAALVSFAEAVVGGDDETLKQARAELLGRVGPEGLVDAAAVVGNFQRMVRIADGTGIPLDASLEMMTTELRHELGIDRFGSAVNTPIPGPFRRTLGRWLRPLAMPAMKRVLALQARWARR